MLPNQKLLFVLGKGGVGRSTVAAALAEVYAAQNESVLIVQWTVHDAISPQFALPPLLSHDSKQLRPGISVMNFEAEEAIREYFVDHLKLKMLHSMVIENRHVQRLVHAAPGLQELFFLGRLYWLVHLAQQERGTSFDRIIVDAPAMGHGVSLFRISAAVASMGMAGPLAVECERVSQMLYDESTVGTVVVTIPEELPVEETLEFLPQIQVEMRRPPLFVVLNRCFVEKFPQQELDGLVHRLATPAAQEACRTLASDLQKRGGFATQLASALDERQTPLLRVLDAHLLFDSLTPERVRGFVTSALSKQFAVHLSKSPAEEGSTTVQAGPHV